MARKPKLLIIGHARHGKDTVANYMRDVLSYRVADSSRRAAEIFLFDLLRAKYGYKDFEECYQDRVNHRTEWYDEICKFNTPDKTRLARNIMSNSDIYVGMRDREEIIACIEAKIFHAVIWVDACQRKPLEPKSSFNIDMGLADIVIDNNGDLDQLYDVLEGID